MNKLLFTLATVIISISLIHPAEARVRVGIGIGLGYPAYYSTPYYYPYPPYYPYAPPVYYAPPPPVVYAPPPAAYAPGIPANQASPTFTDENGRTCREYQTNSSIGGTTRTVYGTACLQPDGTWRIVS